MITNLNIPNLGSCSYCQGPNAAISSTEFDSFVRVGVTRSFCSQSCGKSYPGSPKQAEDNLRLAESDAARANMNAKFWRAEAARRLEKVHD